MCKGFIRLPHAADSSGREAVAGGLLFGKYLRIFRVASIIRCILAVFAIGMAVGTGVAFSQDEAVLEKLKRTTVNFHEVIRGVYRSGLIPEEAAPLLKELGIKTVLSFDNNRKRAEREKERLERLGINVILIPWSGWDEPEDEAIAHILRLMESHELRPILVHCKQGQERTGVVVACWRMAQEKWSADEAYREMKTYGFRSFRYGHLKKYVYHFARRQGNQNAEIENVWERMKTNVLYFFYRLRKLNPFLSAAPFLIY